MRIFVHNKILKHIKINSISFFNKIWRNIYTENIINNIKQNYVYINTKKSNLLNQKNFYDISNIINKLSEKKLFMYLFIFLTIHQLSLSHLKIFPCLIVSKSQILKKYIMTIVLVRQTLNMWDTF